MHVLAAEDEFERLSARSAVEFGDRILDLAHERARPVPHQPRILAARESVGRMIVGTSAVAHMLGRRRVLLEADQMRRGTPSHCALAYAASDQNLIPNVPPHRAIEAMVKREPRLADGYLRVQTIYSQERAFAVAKSADEAVTRRVHSYIVDSLRKGTELPEAARVISELGNWATAYAETVFRTNLNTAYASGRFLEASDPDLAGFIVGMERMEVMDSRTRDNHAAAHGLKAGLRDPIWLRLGLPGGYN
jgi:hypothetical protein